MSCFDGPNVPTTGLLLQLDAGNIKSYPGSGAIWYDLSGNNNHFTLNGTLTYSQTNGFSGFTQTNRFYRTGFPTSLKTSQGGNGYTTLVWCKANGTAGWQKIIGNGDNDNYIDLYLYSGTTKYYQEDGSTLYYNDYQATPNNTLVLTVGNWYLLSSTNLNSGTLTNPIAAFGIGAEGSAAYNYPFNGNIASVSLYNRVLTASEIITYYTASRSRYGL
jgi:hypothetical protein